MTYKCICKYCAFADCCPSAYFPPNKMKCMASVQCPDKQNTILGVVSSIENFPTADVVPKSEEGAECPTCHGTGRIGTTDWLTKGLSKKQIAEEKAKAVAEHDQHIKAEVARKIFEEIERLHLHITNEFDLRRYNELKKKYTEGDNEN